MGRRHDPAAAAASPASGYSETQDPEALLAAVDDLPFVPEDDADLAALDDEALHAAIFTMLGALDEYVGLGPETRRRRVRAIQRQVEPLADGEDPLAEAELARPPAPPPAPVAEPKRIKRHSCEACTCVIGPGYHSDEVYYDPDARQRLCRMCADWRNQAGGHARCQRIIDAGELLALPALQRERLMQERLAALRATTAGPGRPL
jgi:hypothetical protein